MKFTLLALSLVIGSFANAASLDSCNNEIKRACGEYTDMARFDINSNGKECKFAQQADGSNHIVFIGSYGQSVYSVDTKACLYSYYEFNSGVVTDVKQNDGRVFILLNSNRVVVIGLNNHIVEMLNSKGKSYSTVTDLSVIDGLLTMKQSGGGPIELTMEQLDKRLNTEKTREILDESDRNR